MTAKDKERVKALSGALAEELAYTVGRRFLPEEWMDLLEAVGLFVFAKGELERTAATGALVYSAAHAEQLT